MKASGSQSWPGRIGQTWLSKWAPGELLTLLGPSGCGKTTALNLIAGVEAPDAGAARIDGVDVGGLPPHRREVGMVFQDYALFPHLTVRESVAFRSVCAGSRAPRWTSAWRRCSSWCPEP